VLSIRDAIAIEDLGKYPITPPYLHRLPVLISKITVSKRNDAATAKWGFNWQFSPVKDPCKSLPEGLCPTLILTVD
jgi:hypothetical protein